MLKATVSVFLQGKKTMSRLNIFPLDGCDRISRGLLSSEEAFQLSLKLL